MKYKIGIIGAGFVGTATEECFQKIAEIKIHDKYKPSESLEDVVEFSDILFMCLPTPMAKDGSCNLSIMNDVVKKVCKMTARTKTIVIKSTVLPGTTKEYSELYSKHLFCFCPEFLTEKNFINDALNQDRIILGYASDNFPELKQELFEFMKDFTKTQRNPAKIYIESSSVAEMVKYTSNCFLATKLSFFNEIYQICQAIGINYDKMVDLVLLDKRIGKSHYKVPGEDGKFGWSLSCLPKDINALIRFAKEIGVDPLVLESVWSKNLIVRDEHDWEFLSQVNGKYDKK